MGRARERRLPAHARGRGAADPLRRARAGLSDRSGNAPDVDEQAADLLAVLDATKSRRAVLLGVWQGGGPAVAFSAAHPQRTAGLVLYGAYAKAARSEDYPIGVGADVLERFAELAAQHWGSDALVPLFAPSRAGDERFSAWWRRSPRSALSPSGVRATLGRRAGVDVRDRLDAVRCPTLVLHRRETG